MILPGQGGGTSLYTSRYKAAAALQVIGPDITPRSEDCPLAGHVHESEWLPWPRPDHHCLLVTPPGSLLVIVNGRLGGYGVGTEDSSNVLMYRLDRGPPDPQPVDPSFCSQPEQSCVTPRWNRSKLFGAHASR